jgi:hypothetical protein
MLSLNARGGLHGDGELLKQSLPRANEFCAARGRGLEADVVSTSTAGVQVWMPQNNQVVFTCAHANAR